MILMLSLLAFWLAWRLTKTRIKLKQAEQMNSWLIEADLKQNI